MGVQVPPRTRRHHHCAAGQRPAISVIRLPQSSGIPNGYQRARDHDSALPIIAAKRGRCSPLITRQDVSVDTQCQRAPERGLLRRAAGRAERGQDVRAGIGGPLADRGERPRPSDHRRDPYGEQPGQLVPAAAPFPWIRDLGQEIKQVVLRAAGISEDVISGRESLVAGHGECRNFHRSARTRPPPADTPDASPAVTTPQVTASAKDFAASLSR
jgi:hypothetical protein